MKKFRCITVVFVMALLFLSVNVAFAVNEQYEADYQKAMALKYSEKYDEAFTILNRLANSSPDIKYHFALIDTILEQFRIMKENKNPAWKTKAYAAKVKIKTMLMSNRSNPEFWLLYAKYSGLVEKDKHFQGGLKKALYYKPGYVDAYIVKGDIYFYQARITDAYETIEEDSVSYTGDYETEKYVRFFKGKEALAAYEKALKSQGITDEKKAAIYYKMAELKLQIFKNKDDSLEFWKKSVELSHDSKWGKLSNNRLNTYK